ncbi:uncharacterized protein DSM5745_03126 [Aspergillus mulundensis]|uniref:ABC multidrug transporter n=1 Tax=Aspergillus mulundensis TaxID=1810919 RepID=A0A3D8SJW1_9EURO|nr:hypothetical protein DSM5745_03126 [Aspergillus mulundensis]RDW86484.1 hypothetical protein DSM5745_03126 [Aspergillus mulundensis]
MECSIDVQDVRGPRVHGCGTDFDLTLLFQESILGIGPLCVALLWAGLRVWQLRADEVVVASRLLYWTKVIIYLLAAVLQITLLVVQGILKTSLTRATIAAHCLSLVGFLVFLLVSHYEHTRTVRPSTLLLLYLLYSTVADALRARTLWSMADDNAAASAVFTVICVCKFVLLVAERGRKSVRPDIRKPSPDEEADIFSRAFLWWMLPLFIRVRLKSASPLTTETLPGVESDMLRPISVGDERPTVFHHLWDARKWLLLTPIIPRLACIGFTFSQPFLVYRATVFMFEPDGPNIKKVGGGLIGAYAVVYVGIAASQAFYRQCTARAISAVRADLIGQIHHHTLKLSSSSTYRDSASMLMSADVERFAAGSRDMHECWACIIELALGIWLLEDRLGVTIAATGGLTAIFVALTMAVVPPAAKRQNKWLKAMENRIAATTQALAAIKGIKMTGVAPTIRKDLLGLRDIEDIKLRHFRYVLLVVAWAAWIPVIMAPIMGFTIYSQAFGHTLTPPVVYRSLTIFTLFGDAIAALINSAIQFVTAIASLLRIQEFLLDDNTRHDSRQLLSDIEKDTESDETSLLPSAPVPTQTGSEVLLRRLSRRLSRRQRPVTLQLTRASAGWSSEAPSIVQNATLDAAAPSILAVVGPIGSGKTTLLQMLLGETQHAAGSVALSSSHIGYCGQTPWLTNDTVRNNIIGSDLFDEKWYSSVVLATALDRDFKEMAHGDATVVANEGGSLSGGQKKRVALARAIYSRAPIVVLDDPFNGLDGRTEGFVLEAVLGRRGLLRQGKTLVVWATSTAQQVRFADRVISLDQNGCVRKRDSLLLVPPTDDTGEEHEQTRNSFIFDVVQDGPAGGLPQGPAAPRAIHASAGAHRYFVRFSGRRKFLVFLVLCAIFVFGVTFNQYWISRWAESSVTDPYSPQKMYIGVYFGIGALTLIFWTAAAAFFVITITQRSADRCHEAILDTVLGAPMSFLDSTAAGETINRFSQDMQLIDTELPYDVLGTVTQAMMVIGLYGIIIYSSPWSGCAIPAVAVAAYFLQLFYLPTSRQLRVLEIEAKAPLFSNFIETLNGLATIRALRWTAHYARRNLDAIRVAQQPFYLLFSAQNWLNLILDLITAGVAVAIMCVGVATRSPSNASLGLALLSASNVGVSAKRLISHWTKLETSMAAVERVRFFTDSTPSEERTSAAVVGAQDWHGAGSVSFSNVSAKYTRSGPLVLRDVSITIRPGQRVAICGRTGSGKSTLLSALLRLLPLHSGTIHVDDTDITSLPPNTVRSRFITLLQEPLLITGTVRHNMCLYEPNAGDIEIIAALQAFPGLWEAINAQGGLDVALTEGLLSHGQRQLFCFARSTLSLSRPGGKIVILDEPISQTGSDAETERLMDETIRERFKDCTVLCIAHNLGTIMSFDSVVVMDRGAVAETGSPTALLDDESIGDKCCPEVARPRFHLLIDPQKVPEEYNLSQARTRNKGKTATTEAWNWKIKFSLPGPRKNAMTAESRHRRSTVASAELRSLVEILHPSPDSSIQEKKLEGEAEALWFSVSQTEKGELELEETARFSNLMKQYLGDITSTSPRPTSLLSSSCPRLASFIGNTGAGKSSLIHLLMKHPWDASTSTVRRQKLQDIPLPVVGQPESTIPTSGDVHLYYDALTNTDESQQSKPLLYADCEGFHGGDQQPAGHRPRTNIGKSDDDSRTHVHFDRWYTSLRRGIRRILNLPSRLEAQRKTAIGELFPRILYNFSDVVVHVVISAASRTREEDIVKLLEWAQSSRAAAVNRALLPHLIVVLNMSDPDSELNWDAKKMTAKIFKEHQPALVENKTIREHKEALERIHARIDTLEDLLKYSYSSVQFIKLPNGSNSARLSKQLQVLHQMIYDTTEEAHDIKRKAKMLLCSDDLNTFFRLGFDHYATNLDKPFSFLETIFSLHPLPNELASNYYGIMKAVKIADQHSKTKRSAKEFCDAVVPAICSAIALDVYRSREGMPGTLAQIYRGNPLSEDDDWQVIPGTYLSHLREAITLFENCDCPCDFVSPSGEKCVNALLGHQRATHQNAAGRDIGFGPFESQFVDDLQNPMEAGILEALDDVEKQLENPTAIVREGGGRDAKLNAIWAVHEANLRQLHSLVPGVVISNPSTCSWCFRKPPTAILPCGHGVCRACMIALSVHEHSTSGEDPRLIRIDQCFFHPKPVEFMPFRFLLLPEWIGKRLLTLDSDGTKSKFHLDILAAIEQRLGGSIPVQRFFDMVGGSGAGGLLALGLGIGCWTTQEAFPKLRELSDGLQRPEVTIWDWFTSKKQSVFYQTRPWEDAIKRAFGHYANTAILQTKCSLGIPSVFVTATKEDGRGALIANYIRPNSDSSSLPALPGTTSNRKSETMAKDSAKDATYEFVRCGLQGGKFKVWEAARATTAIPGLFEHFMHANRRVYLGGPEFKTETARVVLYEAQSLWPGVDFPQRPDLLLSIDGGPFQEPEQPDLLMSDYYIKLSSDPSKRSSNQNQMAAFDFADTERPGKALSERLTIAVDELAYRLLSTSFYFDPTHVQYEDNPNQVTLQGYIRCRFADRSVETKALGHLLRSYQGSRFTLNEGSQDWIMDEAAIKELADHGVLSLFIEFNLRTPESKFTISLATFDFTRPISACPISISDITTHI